MNRLHTISQALPRRQWLRAAAGAAVLGTVPVWAQRSPGFGTYQPEPFQAGKDVVWVPTPDALVTRMLQMAGVTRHDHVIDLGAGDGKIVIAAARQFGARALGIEFNPELVAHAQRRARAAGVADRARIVQGDIFEADLSAASVITLYLLTELNLKLRPTLLRLKPGTRLVTHAFGMGTWQPDEHSRAGGATAYLWLVPANVGGHWRLSYPRDGQTVNVQMTVARQVFQFPEGTVHLGAAETSLRDARVAGERVRWAFTDTDGVVRQFSGRVDGARIEGTVTGGGASARFSAERQGEAPAILVSA